MLREHTLDTTQIRAHRIALTARCFGNNETASDCSCQLLDDHLSFLELAISEDSRLDNVGQIQEMLLELSLIIRSRALTISEQGHRRMLDRLTGIYAQGLSQRSDNAFLLTASDYADVVEAIGACLPRYDYSTVIGQLLFYMTQLYLTRKGSWMTIYEHLTTLPDAIEGIVPLKQECFAEIRRWTEEGVANLFQIQRDLQARQTYLQTKSRRLQKKIDWLHNGCCPDLELDHPFIGHKVTRLDQYKIVNQIRTLRQQQEQVQAEIAGKQETAQLIESNIREFEGKLQSAHRTYLVQAVS